MRHEFLRCVAVGGWLALAPVSLAITETVGEAEPRWRPAGVWRQSEGLPQDSVIAILQTRDGYLWVGTRAGVARFDGVRFTTFDARHKAQLSENEVWALAEGEEGSLWVGVYGGGLSRLKDGRFTTYRAKDGLVDDFVRHLALDAGGALWIGTDHGVSRFKDGRFTSYTKQQGLLDGMVRALLPGPDGVLVATAGGLQRIAAGRIEALRLPGEAQRAISTVDVLWRDRRGALWIGSNDGLLRVLDGSTTRYTTADGLSSNAIRQLHEDSAGRLWIGTAAGLDRHRGEAPPGARAFANQSPANDLLTLHADREGSVWLGHRGRGLARLHQTVFSTYAAEDGLVDSEITTVLHGRGGAAWIGTTAGLSVLHDGRITTIGEASGLPRSTVSALAEDRRSHLWVATNNGIYRSAEPLTCGARCDPRFRPLGDDPILRGQARVIFEDRSGAVWIGTDRSGLARWQEGRVTKFTTAAGLSHDAIRALADGKDGSLWIGTKGGGLNRLKDGAFTVFKVEDGLPNDNIQALYMDAKEALWIATRQGLSRHKDGRFTTYSLDDGLYWSHVYSFVEDDKGNLWMSSGRGVFRVSKRQLDDFADGRIKTIVSTAYGREHGLPSTMAAVATHPGAAKSQDGRVWVAMAGGLAVADPKRMASAATAPPVHIEDARIDGRVVDQGGTREAPPGRGDLLFRYTALSYEAPHALRFKYRLDGFDGDWVDAETRRIAQYTNMPPGRYRFRVIAGNNDGVWNDRGAEIALALAPHFYQTRWFYGALALSLILAGAGTQYLRTRGLQQRARELAARVQEAKAQVKVLRGLLPTCSSCKKIRDDKGYWNHMETYIHEHSEADFTHGICPECVDKLYPAYSERFRDRRKKKTPPV